MEQENVERKFELVSNEVAEWIEKKEVDDGMVPLSVIGFDWRVEPGGEA